MTRLYKCNSCREIVEEMPTTGKVGSPELPKGWKRKVRKLPDSRQYRTRHYCPKPGCQREAR